MANHATYKRMILGNDEFRTQVYPAKAALFSKLAGQQHPHVTLLTCSDSRIDPCLITQSDPGDLFVIRNAGNIVSLSGGAPNAELAALEFAVKGLKTEHIVVCGHSDCGAMKGLLNPEKTASLTHVCAWVREAQPALASVADTGLTDRQRLNRLIEANVALQLENLRQLDFVAEAELSGQVQLHGWVFDIASGKITELSKVAQKVSMASAA